MDVVFVLDSSGSISEKNFQLVKDYGSDLARSLDIESGRVRVGAMTFSQAPNLEFHLNQYTNRYDVMDAFQRIRYIRQSTATDQAIRYLRSSMFTNANGDRYVV